MNYFRILLSIMLTLLSVQVFPQKVSVRDFKAYFDRYGVEGCFVSSPHVFGWQDYYGSAPTSRWNF